MDLVKYATLATCSGVAPETAIAFCAMTVLANFFKSFSQACFNAFLMASLEFKSGNLILLSPLLNDLDRAIILLTSSGEIPPLSKS